MSVRVPRELADVPRAAYVLINTVAAFHESISRQVCTLGHPECKESDDLSRSCGWLEFFRKTAPLLPQANPALLCSEHEDCRQSDTLARYCVVTTAIKVVEAGVEDFRAEVADWMSLPEPSRSVALQAYHASDLGIYRSFTLHHAGVALTPPDDDPLLYRRKDQP